MTSVRCIRVQSVQSRGRWSFSRTVCKAGGSDHVRDIICPSVFYPTKSERILDFDDTKFSQNSTP